jgi:hypothetical protein
MHDPMPSAWFYRIKAAQRDLIKRCGGIERAGEIAHMSKTQMGRFNSDSGADLMSLPVVLMLEADCGCPLVTEAMAELQGRRDRRADGGESAGNADVQMRHADVIVRMGEMVSAAAMAFADGRLTPAEAALMDRAAASVDRAVADLRQALAGARA